MAYASEVELLLVSIVREVLCTEVIECKVTKLSVNQIGKYSRIIMCWRDSQVSSFITSVKVLWSQLTLVQLWRGSGEKAIESSAKAVAHSGQFSARWYWGLALLPQFI